MNPSVSGGGFIILTIYELAVSNRKLPSHVQITNPPLGLITWPVMKSAAGDAKNSIAAAMSLGEPKRPSGVSSHSASLSAGENAAFICVSITPGATQLT